MDQAAENEGTAVLLDSVGRNKIHLAAEQRFQAIGQVDEAEADRLGEAHQQIWLIRQGKRLLAVASSVANEPNSCRLLGLNSAARPTKCSRSTANTSARLVQGWATEVSYCLLHRHPIALASACSA